MRVPTLLSSILFLLVTSSAGKTFSKSKDAVLLSKIRTLTLQAEKQTSHRRVKAIPQLQCVGGNAKGLYDVDVMRCRNSGSEYDAEDIQWTCQASLPPEFKLGSTEVVCEGYDNSDDPYVLKGSCGVEYRLMLTERGDEKYGRTKFDRWSSMTRQNSNGGILNQLWRLMFWGVFLAVVGVILYRIFYRDRRIALPDRGGFRGFGGGGGGGGGGDDPPPPYTPRAPPRPKSESAKRSTPRSSSSQSSSGPGWYGAAAGAAAGYGAGYYMGRRNNDRERERERQFNAPSSSRSPFGNFFGGRGGSPPSGGAGGSSSFSSAPAPSSSRYESTGFGGTRRR